MFVFWTLNFFLDLNRVAAERELLLRIAINPLKI